MEAYQERVIEEKRALDVKLKKLRYFVDNDAVFVGLPQAEKRRLNRQLNAMEAYSYVLGERIAAFKL